MLIQLRAENGQVSYLQPALDWLDGWLAELNGAPEQAREIYQHGQDTADTRSPVYTARLLRADPVEGVLPVSGRSGREAEVAF